MDISVVIPSHRDPAGLYFTVAAAITDLEHSGAKWEIIAVVDGESHDTVRSLRQRRTVRVVRGEFGSPQAARHAGAEKAAGRYIFFLDSHVIPCRDFFVSMKSAAYVNRAAIVFSPHRSWDSKVSYGYGIDWNGNLWSKDAQQEPESPNPYRVAMMGHGGICVDRDAYQASGGYWTAQRGWGGEETHLTLKLWMLGYQCFVDPRVYHWHYMAKRRDAEVFRSRDHVRNFLIAAYALGGQRYLDRCHLKYSMGANRHKTIAEARAAKTQRPYADLYAAAPREAAEERARICAGPFNGDLDKLREFFRAQGIHH